MQKMEKTFYCLGKVTLRESECCRFVFALKTCKLSLVSLLIERTNGILFPGEI